MDTCFTINVPASLSMESADELYQATSKNLQGISWIIFDFGKVTFVTPCAIILVVTGSGCCWIRPLARHPGIVFHTKL